MSLSGERLSTFCPVVKGRLLIADKAIWAEIALFITRVLVK
jgi:hypothetical protein